MGKVKDLYYELKPKKVTQYGDTFLVKIKCHECGAELFIPYGKYYCPECGMDAEHFYLDLENVKFKCVVGSIRQKRFPKRLIHRMFLSQDGACAYCDEDLESYHIEHIIPLICGGSNNIDNLVLSCPQCNLKAGKKYFKSFLEKKKYILTHGKDYTNAY